MGTENEKAHRLIITQSNARYIMAEKVSEQLITSILDQFLCPTVRYMNRRHDYIRYEGMIKEEFLSCKSSSMHSTAEDIFDILKAFIFSNGIDWSKCVGLSTDGEQAEIGNDK